MEYYDVLLSHHTDAGVCSTELGHISDLQVNDFSNHLVVLGFKRKKFSCYEKQLDDGSIIAVSIERVEPPKLMTLDELEEELPRRIAQLESQGG